jgi:hypothetical protein
LQTAIGIVDEPAAMDGPSTMKRVVQCIEDEARMGCPAHPPTYNAACKGIDYEGHVDEVLPNRHVSELG